MKYRKDSEMFDLASDYYDQFRPGYPRQIVETLVNHAHLNATSRILEIGAGSGKATEQFLNYGCQIHCVEPGRNLVERGKQRFQKMPQVSYECVRFEELEEQDERYDAIFAAQSFHWVEQPIGYQKCAALLKPGGILAPFWNMYLYDESEEHQELIRISGKHGGLADFVTVKEAEERILRISESIAKSSLFERPEVHKVCWEQEYTLEQYYGFVQTGNHFLQLSNEEKECIYSELSEHFREYDGMIRRPYWTVLYLSKREGGESNGN